MKFYIASSFRNINNVASATTTFYHIDEVQQCIGPIENLIETITG
ncbi:hypothetical protein SAMN05216378_1702 [Paenibacillus catalpae]|uniref:Uncharacterized protein n=1 Tax=Paenibacillus catalpae TaxID=1045775 RepID=A0A1I1VN60_9BACL|nr:hypothetical protein SAMN05216378_1702 [Paenibacillus catalpae]